MKTAAKVFMILSCVSSGLSMFLLFFAGPITGLNFFLYTLIALIPLCWTIPMTVHYFHCTNNHLPIGTGFKVCTLLFV